MRCWHSRGTTWVLSLAWLGLAAAACAQEVANAPAEPMFSSQNQVYEEGAWPVRPPLGLIEQWPEPGADSVAGSVLVDEEAMLFAPQMAPAVAPRRRDEGMGGPGQDRSPLKVGAVWTPSQNVRGQAGELSMTGLRASLAFPLYIEPGGRSLWVAMTNLEHLELGGSAMLPDSGVPLPAELWKFSLGLLRSRELDNGWRTGFMVNVGSASDQPFAGIRDMTVLGLGFLNVPARENDAWNFSLFYSPTSQLPFPIPGVAYVWRPSEQFTANIGIPFSLSYQPTDAVSFTASYMPLTNVALRASQKLGIGWSAYAAYQVVNETYWLSERQNTDDRLYLFDQRVTAGLERPLAFGFCLDLSAAYLFDRRIFQAESFSDDRHDILRIGAGPAASLTIRWTR